MLISGLPTLNIEHSTLNKHEIVPHLEDVDFVAALYSAKKIICRSGYSTIMDLVVLGKKAFFIPTPGQFEQEYLAQKLDDKKISPFCAQDKFTLDELKRVSLYSGFKSIKSETNFEKLFSLF